MSKLPYVFLAIPHEFLTEDFLRDPIMMRFIVWMIKRISPHPSMVPLKGKGKQLLLEPFEFMFGRETCALAAGISLKNVYTRIKQLTGLGYLKKVDSKGSSTYSVFVLEIKDLRQSVNGQQNEQHLGQQIGQQTGHNLETKNADYRKKKETFSVITQNSNIKENRLFTEDFVRRRNWNDIKITQSYCTHPPSCKDYSFKLPPEDFREMLVECYEQHRPN